MDAALVYLTQYNDKVAIVVANFALLTDLYININQNQGRVKKKTDKSDIVQKVGQASVAN